MDKSIYVSTHELFCHYYLSIIGCKNLSVPHRLVASIDPHQEEGLSDEQADAEVLVDGVAIALEAAEEAEGEEADEEADQRQEDPNPCDDIEEHVVNRVCVLKDKQ